MLQYSNTMLSKDKSHGYSHDTFRLMVGESFTWPGSRFLATKCGQCKCYNELNSSTVVQQYSMTIITEVIFKFYYIENSEVIKEDCDVSLRLSAKSARLQSQQPPCIRQCDELQPRIELVT